jgi:hypothetical protein
MNADFEKQLQRQPLREPPRDWRAEILAAADSRPSTWPSFRAWTALAAVWVVIFLLHLTAPDEPYPTWNPPGMTMRSFAMLHEQTLMMADSLGQPNPHQPAAAVPAPPKPRSDIARKQLIG